jgi:hypothetical protein
MVKASQKETTRRTGLILEIQVRVAGIGLVWLKVGTSGGVLVNRIMKL